MNNIERYEEWVNQQNPEVINSRTGIKPNKNFDKITPEKRRYRMMLDRIEWKELRHRILVRDNFTCKNCGSKNNLDVHHLLYIGLIPWNVPERFLVTLCRECHEKLHRGKLRFDKDNIIFGDNLMKRTYVIRLLWNNDLKLPISLLKKEFAKEFPDDNIYKYVKTLKEQGLIRIDNDIIYATDKEIRRVRISTEWI